MSSDFAKGAIVRNIIKGAHPLSQKKAWNLICYYVKKFNTLSLLEHLKDIENIGQLDVERLYARYEWNFLMTLRRRLLFGFMTYLLEPEPEQYDKIKEEFDENLFERVFEKRMNEDKENMNILLKLSHFNNFSNEKESLKHDVKNEMTSWEYNRQRYYNYVCRKFMDEWLTQRRAFNISKGYTNKGKPLGYENNRFKRKEGFWLLEKIQAFNKTQNLVILEQYMYQPDKQESLEILRHANRYPRLYKTVKDNFNKKTKILVKDLSVDRAVLEEKKIKIRKDRIVMDWSTYLLEDNKYFKKIEVSKNNASFVYRTLRDLRTLDTRRRKTRKRRKRRSRN